MRADLPEDEKVKLQNDLNTLNNKIAVDNCEKPLLTTQAPVLTTQAPALTTQMPQGNVSVTTPNKIYQVITLKVVFLKLLKI